MYAHPRPRRGLRPAPASHRGLSPHPRHPPSRLPPGRRPAGVQGHVPDRVCLWRASPERQLLSATAAADTSPKTHSAVLTGAPAPTGWKLAGAIFWHGASPGMARAPQTPSPHPACTHPTGPSPDER
jgi:hypothetical protein